MTPHIELAVRFVTLVDVKDYFKSFLIVFATAFLGYIVEPFIGYRAVGYIFLLSVIGSGFFGSMGVVFFAALLSVFAWNFLLIPPKFAFYTTSVEDMLMCSTYFIVAAITGTLMSQFRKTRHLQESEKIHQTLLNSISHELRTPLTTIVGIASSLENGLSQNADLNIEVGRELGAACDRLNHVIENLLDMSRLNAGRMELHRQWHDPQDLIGVSLSKMGKQLEGHTIEFDLKRELPLVEIDFRLMEHALSNVVLNAARYSPAGLPIRVEAFASRTHVVISIHDKGPGIPENQKQLIFEKFYRLNGSKPGGIGLGLSITKSILELHGGTISVEKSSLGGAQFNLNIPVRESPKMPLEESHV